MNRNSIRTGTLPPNPPKYRQCVLSLSLIHILDDPVDITGVEPLGRGEALGDHAASMKFGEKGIMHGFESIMLKDEKGEPAPVYSIASGLDYPSVGPEQDVYKRQTFCRIPSAGWGWCSGQRGACLSLSQSS